MTDGPDRDRLRAATHAARHAGQNAMLLLAAGAVVYAIGIVFLTQDLVYLHGVGGVPTAARAYEMNGRAKWVGNLCWIAFLAGTFQMRRWLGAASRAAFVGGAHPRPTRGPALAARLFGPYQRLRALDEAIDPARIASAPLDVTFTEHAGSYRAPASQTVTTPRVKAAPLVAWWLSWLGCTGVLIVRYVGTYSWMDARELDATGAAAGFVATALAVVIIRRINGRLAERARHLIGARAIGPA